MVVKNVDNIADDIYNRVENIPLDLSGTELKGIVDDERIHMENYTGLSIGSTSILEKYQPALQALATASVLSHMQMVGIDGTTVKLGDFSIRKGTDSSTSSAQLFFEKKGEKKLRLLGKKIGFKKAFG